LHYSQHILSALDKIRYRKCTKKNIPVIMIFVKIRAAKSVKYLRKARTNTLTFCTSNHSRL